MLEVVLWVGGIIGALLVTIARLFASGIYKRMDCHNEESNKAQTLIWNAINENTNTLKTTKKEIVESLKNHVRDKDVHINDTLRHKLELLVIQNNRGSHD